MVERAKYDAWKKLGNISKEKAQEQYIKVIESVWPKWNEKAKLWSINTYKFKNKIHKEHRKQFFNVMKSKYINLSKIPITN